MNKCKFYPENKIIVEDIIEFLLGHHSEIMTVNNLNKIIKLNKKEFRILLDKLEELYNHRIDENEERNEDKSK